MNRPVIHKLLLVARIPITKQKRWAARNGQPIFSFCDMILDYLIEHAASVEVRLHIDAVVGDGGEIMAVRVACRCSPCRHASHGLGAFRDYEMRIVTNLNVISIDFAAETPERKNTALVPMVSALTVATGVSPSAVALTTSIK